MQRVDVPTAFAPALAPVRSRRRPWVIGLGAMLTALGSLGVVWLVGAAGQRQEVLVVLADVAYGETVSDSAVGLTRVSVDPGVQVVPATQRESIVGQVAATHLTPGSLVVRDMVEPAGEPRAGRVLVPIALAPERMPAGGLRAGDLLLAVDTAGDPDSDIGLGGPADEAPFAIPVSVVRIGEPDVNGITMVDVTASSSSGARLAVAAAHGRLAVVVQPPRP